GVRARQGGEGKRRGRQAGGKIQGRWGERVGIAFVGRHPCVRGRGWRRRRRRFTSSLRHVLPPQPRAQMALAAMLTVRASSAALKMNERMPWAATVRRIGLHETATSDTCDVMPITNEK